MCRYILVRVREIETERQEERGRERERMREGGREGEREREGVLSERKVFAFANVRV